MDLKWIYDIRQTGVDEIEILTDPWEENAAIWKFDVLKKTKTKIKDFNHYKGIN